jgi:hypothetical protein
MKPKLLTKSRFKIVHKGSIEQCSKANNDK